MTLQTDIAGLFSVGAPPQTADATGILRWCNRLFNFLGSFLRRPEFPGIVFSRIDTVVAPEFKAENGMMVYVGPGVLGPNEGLYIRMNDTWQKIQAAP